MYDIVYNFITNQFFNTTHELHGLNYILTDITMILFYVCLVSLLVWVFNVVRGCID